MKDSNQNLKYKSKGNMLRMGILIISIILLTCLVFYGTFRWQHGMVTDLQNQVAQLNSRLTNAQKQASTVLVKDEATYVSDKGVTIKIYSPSKGTKVTTPLVIIGEVPGNWSFEASFPVVLKDSNGNVVAQAPAQLLGDWMTTELVPFSLKLPYTTPVSGNGSVTLQKDNPSGLSQNDDSVTIPITF